MDRKIELISKVPLFARCSKGELREIAAAADEIDLPEGKVLTREGDRGREFFVLLDGTAEVRRSGELIRTLGAGDFLGEIALISQEPRTATVTTASPVRALVITDQSFGALLSHQPGVREKVLETLADRLAPDSL
jgi:CRP/FNR family cyclic AMP-dependent transcriptional regulator